jgi:uncharacterized protein (TIGR02466 family)
MPIDLLWPTPVYYSRFDEDEDSFDLIQTEIKKAISITNIHAGPFPFSNFETDFSIENHNNFCSKTPNLNKYIYKHIKQYTDLFVNINDFVMSESWINFYVKGNFQEFHSHQEPNNCISGIYYHQTNNKDGQTVFRCPTNDFGNQAMITKFTPNDVVYDPEAGKIVLFPSFLHHCVSMNKTDNTRITISFNIKK